MNNLPEVSIVMNCYNCDCYLKEAIDSVLSQTYNNWEIIFWDNQSRDNSAEIVKRYSDSRIKYFYSLNHTVLGEARNLAVEKATGEWICFLDCDDIWMIDKLEKQIDVVVEKKSVGFVYGKMKFLVEETGDRTFMAKSIKKKVYPYRELPSGNIFNELLYDCFIPLPSALFKRSTYWEVGGIDSSLKVAEDYDLFLKIAKIENVAVMKNVSCLYRVHGNNLSHSNTKRTFEESIDLVRKYLPNEHAKKSLVRWEVRYAFNMFKNKEYFVGLKQMLSIKKIFYFIYFVIIKMLRKA